VAGLSPESAQIGPCAPVWTGSDGGGPGLGWGLEGMAVVGSGGRHQPDLLGPGGDRALGPLAGLPSFPSGGHAPVSRCARAPSRRARTPARQRTLRGHAQEARFHWRPGSLQHHGLRRARDHGLYLRSRFLLLGQWPVEEVGWWYIFLSPRSLRSITPGLLLFGPRVRPALQIRYWSNRGGEQRVHLAFTDQEQRARVWAGLRKGANSATLGAGDGRSETTIRKGTEIRG